VRAWCGRAAIAAAARQLASWQRRPKAGPRRQADAAVVGQRLERCAAAVRTHLLVLERRLLGRRLGRRRAAAALCRGAVPRASLRRGAVRCGGVHCSALFICGRHACRWRGRAPRLLHGLQGVQPNEAPAAGRQPAAARGGPHRLQPDAAGHERLAIAAVGLGRASGVWVGWRRDLGRGRRAYRTRASGTRSGGPQPAAGAGAPSPCCRPARCPRDDNTGHLQDELALPVRLQPAWRPVPACAHLHELQRRPVRERPLQRCRAGSRHVGYLNRYLHVVAPALGVRTARSFTVLLSRRVVVYAVKL
jgi:hypothetical protein